MGTKNKISKELEEVLLNGDAPDIGDIVMYIGPNIEFEGFWQIDDWIEDEHVSLVRVGGGEVAFSDVPMNEVSRAIPEYLLKRMKLVAVNKGYV